MRKIQSERIMEDELMAVLVTEGFRVVRQWRLGGKHVDIVGEDTDGRLTAIEVKLSDWRRAAVQASLNGPYFHRTFIALPSNPRRKLDLEFLEALGVGVLEVTDGKVQQTIAAPERPVTSEVEAAIRSALA